jgi:hypothetical protein
MITTWGPTATCSSLNVLPPFSTGRTTLERALELRDAHAARDGAPPPQPAPAMAISGPVLVKRMPRGLLRISRRDVVRVLLQYRGAGSKASTGSRGRCPRRSVHETQQRAVDQQHHGRRDVAAQEVNTVSRCALSSFAGDAKRSECGPVRSDAQIQLRSRAGLRTRRPSFVPTASGSEVIPISICLAVLVMQVRPPRGVAELGQLQDHYHQNDNDQDPDDHPDDSSVHFASFDPPADPPLQIQLLDMSLWLVSRSEPGPGRFSRT